MKLKLAGKSGQVKVQVGETERLSRYTAEAKKAAENAENSAERAETALAYKQDALVSGVNIKTVNDQSLLGSGNIVISGDGTSIAIDSELSDTSANAVQNRVITGAVREIERALNMPPPIGLGMTGAAAGQVPVVKTVDENGVPISYEPGAVGGDGLPIGGTAGSVLEKASAADYDAKWTNTPTLLGNLAAIEPTGFASKEYLYGDFLVCNGQLYRVKIQTISQGDTLMPGTNVEAVAIGDKVTAISNSLSAINQGSVLRTFFEDGISAYKRGGVISLNIGYNRTITGSSGQWLALATVPVLFRPTRTIKFIGWDNSANRGENNYALDFQISPSGVVNVWVWPDLLSFSPHATVTYIV